MNTLQIEPLNDDLCIQKDITQINVAIFGHGLVGGTLINQMILSTKDIERRKGIRFNIFAIANSKQLLLNENGVDKNWKTEIQKEREGYTIDAVFQFVKAHQLGNLIAIDNTASLEFITHYKPLIKAGFNLVSSNKIANTVDFKFYKDLRRTLTKYQKTYLYETNVGAGLPLIDTIRLLHLSGENITRIRGVFSGSLSYLFNTFSSEAIPFSEALQNALDLGYTEPNPREDLSGNDVARKLLVLARELDLHNELSDVTIENLIPEHLRAIATSEFLESFETMNAIFQARKENQKEDHVLRYIGDLHGDLSDDYGGKLDVKLVSVPKNSPLGALTGADSIFEIYTESYGKNPIVIQGAGAGAEVTARGVFGDILRLIEKIINK